MEGVARLDGGHLRNLIALLRRGADTSQAFQEGEDGVRQALLGDHRGATRGHVLRQVHRDGDLADVEGALLLRQVIPVGVGRDDDLPVALGILAQVEGVLIHLISRVGHEVAVPQQGGRSTQERGLIGGGVQARESLLRLDSLLQQRIRGGLLKARKQVCNRLVLLGNARHGHGAGDDAHLVSGVALILRLPEGVLAEPGLQVTVQGRHPRHGLDVLVVQGNPPGGIARRDLGGACGGVSLQQLRCGCGGVVDVVKACEEGFNLAVIRRVQAGFDAVQEIEKTVIPARIHKRVGQLHKALDPLGVGHGLDIAEVGLAGLGQGVDDVLAVCRILLDAQGSNQARSRGEGVIEVVDIRQKVGLRGCHAVRTGAAAYPSAVLLRADSGGVDQKVLDGISGLGLLGGHGDGAEEDGVDRHRRHSVLLRPLTGEIGGGAIRGGDAAADCQVDVGVLADFGIGIQQHVIQVDPGVVAAGMAVLDLHDDAILRVGRGDG